ncbi:hypothetical protein DIJ64_10610 [Mycobacterium leprae]|uniref:Uncharacterized protein n=1 Tax=Mycobacterium leprae TaxID=1769 RepID=A0AAD0KW55_MYCLR|nr:hypothetical protein [Mycobacterium leprae]AWV48346.1 hypothetical protein DIJ64_10610 [Mycobacterium leprae]OAR20156.1 hypothetical protein A8144_11900 [Mycobacterium leprae 3125609]OAX70507.1 hypothetical protein A3216_11535 [Mycobacterium leprae 7935681]
MTEPRNQGNGPGTVRPAGAVPSLTGAVRHFLAIDPVVRIEGSKTGAVVKCAPAEAAGTESTDRLTGTHRTVPVPWARSGRELAERRINLVRRLAAADRIQSHI